VNSHASRVNRIIVYVATGLVTIALLVPISKKLSEESVSTTTVASSSTSTSTSTSVPEESDTTVPVEESEDFSPDDASNFDYEPNAIIDLVVGKKFVTDRSLSTATVAYPFPELTTSRRPPNHQGLLRSDIYEMYNYGGGIEQSPFIPELLKLSNKSLTCKEIISLTYNPLACGVAVTPRGRFLLNVTRPWQNSLSWFSADRIIVTVWSEVIIAGSTYAQMALQSIILSSNKCSESWYERGVIRVEKIRVGNEDVFVLSLGNGYNSDLSSQPGMEEFPSSHERKIVIAMDQFGSPEVIATYLAEESVSTTSTDRSLILTFGTGISEGDGIEPQKHVQIELLPTANGWRERVHDIDVFGRTSRTTTGSDDKGKKLGFGQPLLLLDYTTTVYEKDFAIYCDENGEP
jgi:hypothetical protein